MIVGQREVLLVLDQKKSELEADSLCNIVNCRIIPLLMITLLSKEDSELEGRARGSDNVLRGDE
jgi:hypothetical protein